MPQAWPSEPIFFCVALFSHICWSCVSVFRALDFSINPPSLNSLSSHLPAPHLLGYRHLTGITGCPPCTTFPSLIQCLGHPVQHALSCINVVVSHLHYVCWYSNPSVHDSRQPRNKRRFNISKMWKLSLYTPTSGQRRCTSCQDPCKSSVTSMWASFCVNITWPTGLQFIDLQPLNNGEKAQANFQIEYSSHNS